MSGIDDPNDFAAGAFHSAFSSGDMRPHSSARVLRLGDENADSAGQN